jgi:hypothetical protein
MEDPYGDELIEVDDPDEEQGSFRAIATGLTHWSISHVTRRCSSGRIKLGASLSARLKRLSEQADQPAAGAYA